MAQGARQWPVAASQRTLLVRKGPARPSVLHHTIHTAAPATSAPDLAAPAKCIQQPACPATQEAERRPAIQGQAAAPSARRTARAAVRAGRPAPSQPTAAAVAELVQHGHVLLRRQALLSAGYHVQRVDGRQQRRLRLAQRDAVAPRHGGRQARRRAGRLAGQLEGRAGLRRDCGGGRAGAKAQTRKPQLAGSCDHPDRHCFAPQGTPSPARSYEAPLGRPTPPPTTPQPPSPTSGAGAHAHTLLPPPQPREVQVGPPPCPPQRAGTRGSWPCG